MSTKSVKKNCWGIEKTSLLETFLEAKSAGPRKALVHITGQKKAKSVIRVFDSDAEARIEVAPLSVTEIENDPALKASPEVRVRDAMGSLVQNLERLEIQEAILNFDLPSNLLPAAGLGLEIALYKFRRVAGGNAPKFKITLQLKGKALAFKTIASGVLRGQAVNLARHLTNLPPNWLNPVSYAGFVKDFFSGLRGVKVEVWDEKRLQSEKMNLHLAVGMGSSHAPRMVRIQYHGGGASKAPIAMVGKGITFDSGGLDIKPSSGMRLMKKDMGGSAAVVAIAFWAAMTRPKVNLDLYLALAENAISSKAFRPSDVIVARNGHHVEIHNTDAEGRLVLADSMDVAITQKTKPKCLIDVATLTGAIKVGLGSQIAGLFANDRSLSKSLHKAGEVSGDFNWPMPLYQKYRSSMHSHFADYINSPDGFGGAITAALFLEKFAGHVPWAHLDIYAWKDSADGAWTESGGSGQAVLCLTEWLA